MEEHGFGRQRKLHARGDERLAVVLQRHGQKQGCVVCHRIAGKLRQRKIELHLVSHALQRARRRHDRAGRLDALFQRRGSRAHGVVDDCDAALLAHMQARTGEGLGVSGRDALNDDVRAVDVRVGTLVGTPLVALDHKALHMRLAFGEGGRKALVAEKQRLFCLLGQKPGTGRHLGAHRRAAVAHRLVAGVQGAALVYPISLGKRRVGLACDGKLPVVEPLHVRPYRLPPQAASHGRLLPAAPPSLHIRRPRQACAACASTRTRMPTAAPAHGAEPSSTDWRPRKRLCQAGPSHHLRRGLWSTRA